MALRFADISENDLKYVPEKGISTGMLFCRFKNGKIQVFWKTSYYSGTFSWAWTPGSSGNPVIGSW
jgi:hypothetical protein